MAKSSKKPVKKAAKKAAPKKAVKKSTPKKAVKKSVKKAAPKKAVKKATPKKATPKKAAKKAAKKATPKKAAKKSAPKKVVKKSASKKAAPKKATAKKAVKPAAKKAAAKKQINRSKPVSRPVSNQFAEEVMVTPVLVEVTEVVTVSESSFSQDGTADSTDEPEPEQGNLFWQDKRSTTPNAFSERPKDAFHSKVQPGKAKGGVKPSGKKPLFNRK